MNILYIAVAVILLGIIIFSHEFGHYFAGRRMGIAISEFAVGMGPKLFGFKKSFPIKGTNESETIKYSLRLIPLGGYCAFLGEDETNSNPRAMNNRPAWKRAVTVAAGPLMNFLVALVLSVGLIASGLILNPYDMTTYPKVTSVIENMPAEKAGLEAGDIITSVNGTEITYDNEGTTLLQAYVADCVKGEPLCVTVNRGGESLAFNLSPEYDEETGRMLIGINMPAYYAEYTCGVAGALPEALKFMWNTVKATLEMLGNLARTLLSGGKVEQGTVSGVVGIVDGMSGEMRLAFSDAFSSGMLVIVYYVMAISLSLGIMNLLPFPALDGGRLLLLIVEIITGKHLKREVEGYINLICLVLLVLLMLLITFSDIKALIR